MSRVLTKKGVNLFLVDPYFKVELARIANITGSGPEPKPYQVMLPMLPAVDSPIPLEQAAQQLHNLSSSDMFKMTSREGQELKLAHHMIGAIVEGRPPDVIAAGKCTFLSKALTSMQYFVTATNKRNAQVHGTEALQHLADAVAIKIPGDKASLQDIAPFNIHHRLVTANIMPAVDSLAKDMSKSIATALAALHFSSTRASPKPEHKAKPSKDTSVQAALDMFK